MSDEAQYNYLNVSGPLRVERITPKDLKGQSIRICVLMGPTGSGKSAFIEALAPQQMLSISKNSFDPVTENVICYNVLNLLDGIYPVIIMDTPGFGETESSVEGIIEMISSALDALTIAKMLIISILYFHPINIVRISNSHRNCMKSVAHVAEKFNVQSNQIVTTMWDTLLYETRLGSATLRFDALPALLDQIVPSLRISLNKFENTNASALSVLDANWPGRHSYVRALGQLHVETVCPKDLKAQGIRVCILMGPTGSGKSAFIEALVPNQKLGISSDSNDSVTQTVICYRVINLKDSGYPVILMDTPGLMDPRISEKRIMDMIMKTLDALRDSIEVAIVTLCYFRDIRKVRVSGEEGNAGNYLKGFASMFKANNINVVTTMWNELWNDRLISGADKRFEELANHTYKSLPSINISLSKFYFTVESTLSILDACRHGWHHNKRKERMDLPQYDALMLKDLMQRIVSEQDKLNMASNDDHQIEAVRRDEERAIKGLHKFSCDLYEFHPETYHALFPNAPCPPMKYDSDSVPSLSDVFCFCSPVHIEAQPAPRADLPLDSGVSHHLGSPHVSLNHNLYGQSLKPVGTLEVDDTQLQTLNPTMPDIEPQLARIIPNLHHLTVKGHISVELVTDIAENAKVYLIMGPTGSGKSSFVEALQGRSQDLKISKDQLAPYTQTINAYHVDNVYNEGCPIYLLDTPGFADSMKSEMEIMSMIPVWMEQSRIHFFHQILFLTPITETRLPGSRQRTVNMLNALLTSTHDLDSVAVITTMWNTCHNDKDFTLRGATIGRFLMTKASVLEILDKPLHKKRAFDAIGFTATPYLYQDLHDRVESAVHERGLLKSEIQNADTQNNPELKSFVQERLHENSQRLEKFVGQFIEYGDPPIGFEDAHKALRELVESVQPALLQSSSSGFANNQINQNMESQADGVRSSTTRADDDEQHRSAGVRRRLLDLGKDRLRKFPGFHR